MKFRNITQKSAFYTIAILLPVVLISLIELGLRLSGYGATYPVFEVAKNQPDYLTPSENMVKRYFHVGASSPKISPDTDYFLKHKPENSLRIVLMGGSSAAGFPYGRFGSPSTILKQQLLRMYPERHIEVINVAMSGVNSYTLRDIAIDVANIQPDAVLIYAGHNEYLGIMGVGSVLSGGGNHITNLAFLALKDVRLFQLLQSLWTQDIPASEGPGRSLMAMIAQTQEIAEYSAVFNAGIGQFRSNMSAVLSTMADAHIPVIISTVVSNERDQAPFKSLPGQPKTSCLPLRPDKDNANAAALYFDAQCAEAAGDVELAQSLYSLAKDRDVLRFRAHESINDVINAFALQNGVFIADSQALFRQQSQHGIIGNNLLVEHLHPNGKGYNLIAQSFLHALATNAIIDKPVPTGFNRYDWSKATLSDVDEALATHKIRRLTSDYPFTQHPVAVPPIAGSSIISRMARQRDQGQSWLAQQPTLLDYYAKQGDLASAARTAAMLFDALPWEHKSAHLAANLFTNAGDLAAAQYYANQAIVLSPNNENYWLTRAEIEFKRGKKTQALSSLNQVLALNPNNAKAPGYIKLIKSS